MTKIIKWQLAKMLIAVESDGSSFPLTVGKFLWVLPPRKQNKMGRDPLAQRIQFVEDEELWFPTNIVAPTGEMVYFSQKVLELQNDFQEKVEIISLVEFISVPDQAPVILN